MKRALVIGLALLALAGASVVWGDSPAHARGGPAAFLHVHVARANQPNVPSASVYGPENNDGDHVGCVSGSDGWAYCAAADGESEDTMFGLSASRCFAGDVRVWMSGTAWRGLGVTYTYLNLSQTNFTC